MRGALVTAYVWADRAASILAGIAAVMAIIMASFVALSAMMRYILGSPFSFTEEFVGLIFIALVFTGMPICTLRRSHISVSIVPDMLRGRARHFVQRCSYVLILVFALWFGQLTWEYMQSMIELGARTHGVRLLLWPWTAILPISCFLVVIAALLRIIGPDIDYRTMVKDGGRDF